MAGPEPLGTGVRFRPAGLQLTKEPNKATEQWTRTIDPNKSGAVEDRPLLSQVVDPTRVPAIGPCGW